MGVYFNPFPIAAVNASVADLRSLLQQKQRIGINPQPHNLRCRVPEKFQQKGQFRNCGNSRNLVEINEDEWHRVKHPKFPRPLTKTEEAVAKVEAGPKVSPGWAMIEDVIGFDLMVLSHHYSANN
ncbi:hypothetical protein CRG98_018495 [Punica granatum]|uniref:Uncharacterized protein n=1 Tax=Punica granatum TaxID=22663 RepID=A0A2I0JXV1_PUNGR|nr:hypothetical protein CRG98_018495 [Punica granatum]